MRRVSYRLPNPTRPSTDVAHRRAGLAEEIRAAVTVSGGLIRAGADALLSHIPTIGNQTTPSDAAAWAVQPVQLEHVADLVYELLDAHRDTAELAAELAEDPSWQAHIEYLRALHRKGREVLARLLIQPRDGTHRETR